jgi:hypothetical protein
MNSAITIARRFNGPPDAGNGGYVAGLIAGAIGQNVNVRLHQMLPIGIELSVVQRSEQSWELTNGPEVLATATLSMPVAEAPEAPSYLDALAASRRYVNLTGATFPTCFVCGAHRERGDGLRIFAGPLDDSDLVAAPWMPDGSLIDESNKVRPEFIWAALDCPGYFATVPAPHPALLGEFSVHIDRLVHLDEPCVVVGWRIAHRGRKYIAGTALYDEDGERCALGVATWIELRR